MTELDKLLRVLRWIVIAGVAAAALYAIWIGVIFAIMWLHN